MTHWVRDIEQNGIKYAVIESNQSMTFSICRIFIGGQQEGMTLEGHDKRLAPCEGAVEGANDIYLVIRNELFLIQSAS